MQRRIQVVRIRPATFRTVACTVLVALTCDAALAQWTQWGGPNRNFVVESARLADKWPEGGPKKLWHRELGDGYSTIIADGGVLYTMYRDGQSEFTIALEADSGKTIWEHMNPSPPTGQMEQFGPGPHSTPLLVGDRLYTIGTNAVLHCFHKNTGAVLWKHDLAAEFGAPIPGYGYGCSPIAYKGSIIVPVDRQRAKPDEESTDAPPVSEPTPPGEGQTLVAFDQASGSVLWKSQDEEISYSSPILINFEGEEQLVLLLARSIIGVKPGTGERLWALDTEPEGSNISTPVWNGKDLLFCSSAYASGARGIRLTGNNGTTTAEQIWYSRKMRIHHGNAIHIGDHIYGSSGDTGPALYMALNMRTGKTAWRQRGFKKANSVYADGKMIILDENGQLALAKVDPKGMRVLSTCTIAERYAWAAPTLVGSTLFVRDRKHIMALDLG